MIQLNHLSLAVPNVTATKAVFERFFDFRCVETKGDQVIAILEGQDGFVLVLTSARGDEPYPRDFHFGFFVRTRTAVDDLHRTLAAGGLEPGEGPGKIRDRYGFYFRIPGNILTEVSSPA